MVAKKEKSAKGEPKEGERKSGRTPKTVERLTVTPTIAKSPKKSASKKSGSTTPKKTKSTGAKKSGTKGKKDKKEKGPKRPATAYLLFSMDHRAKVAKANPEATFGEMGKLLGDAWKSATGADKKKYEALAAKDKSRYDKEKAEFDKK